MSKKIPYRTMMKNKTLDSYLEDDTKNTIPKDNPERSTGKDKSR